jgi:hypothetical protein
VSDRTQIWSSGGGTQSAAIAALIVTGELAPPDLAVIVDTEYEGSATWDYHDSVIAPALERVGVTLHRVKKSDYATVGLYGLNGDLLIPAFTTEGDGVGKLPTYCSNEWKLRVVQRWATNQGVTSADMWMGFSTDELKRATVRQGKWQRRFPLLELRMSRGDCIKLATDTFGPPPRSSCWMCPNKSAHEWQLLKTESPNDFAKAVQFEKDIQKQDAEAWLTVNGIPLADVDFDNAVQGDIFGNCSGGCFT